MNILAGIKAFGGWFLGQSDNSKGMEIVKGVGGWIDGQQFTEQEQAQKYGEWFSKTVDENTDRSRTRRALALMIIRYWFCLLTAAIIVWPVNPTYAEFILAIALGAAMASLVLGVGAFFFGSHLLRTK